MGIPGSRDRRGAEWWVLPCVPRTFKLYHLRPVGTTGMSNPRYVDIFTHLRLSVAVLGLFKKKFSICVEQQDFKTWVASYLAHCLVRGTQEITANARFQRSLHPLFVGDSLHVPGLRQWSSVRGTRRTGTRRSFNVR